MYGLNSIKLLGPGEDTDVHYILEALSERILHSEHTMTMSNIASAMYGLKVIHILIAIIASTTISCWKNLRGIVFQNMNSGASVVRRIVGLLSRRLQSLPDDAITTGQDIVMIMLGAYRTLVSTNILS